MEYRHLGRSGLRVSVLGLGTWLTFAQQGDRAGAMARLSAARDAGINFFDTADGYGRGLAEASLGEALDRLAWPRSSYVLATKLYSGVHSWVNMRGTLNRKYLLAGIEESLQRLRTPFVDLLYCHRPDLRTPLEEIVWTMSDIVASGRALYWGTSEWPAAMIREARALADRHHLRAPVVEQPEYNLLTRRTVEVDYAPLCRDLGLGLTTWSPLASGVLTGKYREGVPVGSRAETPGLDWLAARLTDADRNRRAEAMAVLARAIGATPAQLAIAWCASNPLVSSVILGASNPAQVRENVGALDLLPLLTPDFIGRIEQAVG
jgi:voltage-dependent potassium channel beta subunit